MSFYNPLSIKPKDSFSTRIKMMVESKIPLEETFQRDFFINMGYGLIALFII